jgi:hypothetical protein
MATKAKEIVAVSKQLPNALPVIFSRPSLQRVKALQKLVQEGQARTGVVWLTLKHDTLESVATSVTMATLAGFWVTKGVHLLYTQSAAL